MMGLKKRLGILLMAPFPLQASQIIPLVENKRVEATICADSMNRLAVSNDRITQVFGDEGTFESQNDENTGQIFLKPTLENGTKDLSLTLITEQGVTQDLILKPLAKAATTLILKRNNAKPSSQPVAVLKTLPFQEQVLALLKKALEGKLSLKEEESIRAAPQGYGLTYLHTFCEEQNSSYTVQVFEVSNETKIAIEIQEKAFYQPGDVALVFEKHSLGGSEKTRLYVVRSMGLVSGEA